MSTSRSLSFRLFVLLVFALLVAPATFATTFTVDTNGSAPDNNIGNGVCAVAGGGCTLHAAIQEANAAPGGPHKIVFSISIVNPTTTLPLIQKPMTIDGSFGAPRVELVGAPGIFGLDVQDTASGTTVEGGVVIKNLVIRNFGSEGVALVGNGHAVYNCYIGTDKTGKIAQPNNGAGITITTLAGTPFTFPPDLTGIVGNQIGDPNDATKGNVISGNAGRGVDIFAQRTTLNVVANNMIGVDVTGDAALPNGDHNVSITGNAFGNTIGPGNIISGNGGVLFDGINITGTVMAANVVKGNIIGPSKSIGVPLGAGRHGIYVDSTRFDPAVPEVAVIGPNNTIGYNGGDGIQITGASERVVVKGNLIGVSPDPANPLLILEIPNAQNGVRLTTAGHLVGGATLADRNVISANGASGITLTAGATDCVIQGNVLGRDPNVAVNHPNVRDGITLTNAGNNKIGGVNPGEANIIAGNGINGIKITSSGNGWANLITHNVIFGNAVNASGLGIDLDVNNNAPDPADNTTPGTDPNVLYSNYGQNAPVVGTGVSMPHWDPATGNTVVNWTLETSASTPVTLEFFSSTTPNASGFGEGQLYLGSATTVTDITGHAAGTTPVTPPSPFDSRGAYVTMTATPTNNVPDLPGPTNAGPANNTSEFSNAVKVPNPGVLQFLGATFSNNEGVGLMTITVTRTGGSEGAVSVDYATSDGSAVAPLDYGTSSGTLNWADGDSASKTFTIPIVDDNIFEPTETINLTLTNPGGYAQLGAQNTAQANITDNDVQPAISINDVALAEGNAGTTAFTFDITLSNPSASTVTVNYATADGTATTANNDYSSKSGTATFPPGSVSQQVTVNVNGDVSNEPNETFFVNLTVPVNATILDGQGQGTINNDDGTPTISINDVALSEGNAGTTAFTFIVMLSAASASTVTVDYATADGSATTANGDYVAKSGTVTFPAGSTSQPLTVNVNGDTAFEPNETFVVNLTNPTNATILDNQGQGTINNDDTAPTISINDVSQFEGNSGVTPFTFNVSLSNASSQTVTVNYATADGVATAASGDYQSASGTLTFNPGVTSLPLTINVNGDVITEGSEGFFVNLTTPVNATILDNQGQGVILKDDALPQISINDVTALEGNAGTTAFTFNVTLSNPSASSVTVDYATGDSTATTANNDYVPDSGTLTFLPGVVSLPLTITVNGDVASEGNETFFVNLTNPNSGTILDNQGQGTIVNDDSPTPTFSINNVTQSEGNAGTTTFTFTVSLAPAAGTSVSVDATTADGTATTSDNDYVAKTQTLTFPAGTTTQTFSVTVNGDAKYEPNETFSVNLSANSAGTALSGLSGTGTISNDDAIPSITINDVALNEGNAGTTAFTFNATLSNSSSQTITVDYATADGTGTIGNNDYAGASGTLTFNPGVVSQPVTVNVNGDVSTEANETFFVNLTNVTNATIADSQGTGTILNDDGGGTPTFAISNVTQTESHSGTTTYTFTVTLTPAAAGAVSVDAATADGTATTADSDYVAKTQTLNFPAGVTSQPFVVTVNGDTKFEPTEAFSVVLSNNTAGTVISATNGTASGTINNDDPVPSISISDVTQNEGNSGTTPFTFNVTLSNPSSQTITVDYATSDGSATMANGDYANASNTLTFNPGVTTMPVTVNVTGDVNIEPNEVFFLNLASPVNATLLDNQGVGTIVNDDSLVPTFTISNFSQVESASGATIFTFNVTLSPAAAGTVSVDASTVDGTATSADNDYIPHTQTLTFPPGTTTQPFMVTVNGDSKFETAETFSVVLSNNSPGTATSGVAGVGTITNDDTAPTISIGNVSKNEGNAGTTAFTFTVTLSNASYQTITVDYATADGSATIANADYLPATGTVTFPPNTTTQQITINVSGDTNIEPNETFVVNLTNPTNAAIVGPQGTATIVDDDAAGAIPAPALDTFALVLLGVVLACIAMYVGRA